jgi:hypothetical protein
MAGNFKCPYKSWNMKKNILGLGATRKKPNQNFICTLGVSPSLVSRYCDDYSFWDISGPYI